MTLCLFHLDTNTEYCSHYYLLKQLALYSCHFVNLIDGYPLG